MSEAPAAAPFSAAGSAPAASKIRLIEGPAQPEEPFTGFNEQLADARSKLEQLAGLADAITSLREQLNTSLDTNQRLSAKLAEVKSELGARRGAALESEGRIAELTAAKEEADARIGQLEQQLAGTEQKLLIAQTSRQEAETRIAALQATVDGLDEASARQSNQIETLERRLEQSNAARVEAEEQRDAVSVELERARGDVAALSEQVAVAEGELERLRSAYGGLETRAAEFAAAAGAMMRDVDARLRQFSATLTEADLAPSASLVDGAVATDAADAGGTNDGANAGEASGLGANDLVEVAVDDVDAALDLAVATPPADPALDPSARNLIAELGAEETDLGLLIVLPGGQLFTTNDARVQEAALGLITDVAALIAAHGSPQVLILGHTDDIGEADYNLALSQRRARSVKRVFVDRFGLDPDTLEAHGLGELRPIAANDTREGREANRRIELLIVDRGERVPPEMIAAQ